MRCFLQRTHLELEEHISLMPWIWSPMSLYNIYFLNVSLILNQTGNIKADSFLKSFFEWEAVRHELDKMLRKDPFKCQACTPDMLAVSVDGNRKHYRFKNAAGYCIMCAI